MIASCAYGLKVDSHSDPHNEFYQMGKEVATFSFRHMVVLIIYSSFPKLAKVRNIKLTCIKVIVFIKICTESEFGADL